jgi:hypothetical protein
VPDNSAKDAEFGPPVAESQEPIPVQDGAGPGSSAVDSGSPQSRREAHDWGSFGDARTANVLLAGLALDDADRVVSLIEAQGHRERANIRRDEPRPPGR